MDVLRGLISIVSDPVNLVGSSLQTIYDDQFSHPCTTGMGVNQAYLAISGMALTTLGLYGLFKARSSIGFKVSVLVLVGGSLLLFQSAVKDSVETLSMLISMLITGNVIVQLRLLYLQSRRNALQQHLQQQQAQLALQQAALAELLTNASSRQSLKQLEDISAHSG